MNLLFEFVSYKTIFFNRCEIYELDNTTVIINGAESQYAKGLRLADCYTPNIGNRRNNGKSTIQLWMNDYHSVLITKNSVISKRRCMICGKFLSNSPNTLTKHEKKCKMCSVCKSSYWVSEKKPHICRESRLLHQAMEEQKDYHQKDSKDMSVKFVTPIENALDATYTGETHVCYADFETFHTKENTGENVYAAYTLNKDMYGEEGKMFVGPTSIERFIDEIHLWSQHLYDVYAKFQPEGSSPLGRKKKKPPIVGTLVMFNGGRFDHFFIMNELVKRSVTVEKIVMKNGALMSFIMFGNVQVFDLCRFVISSLRQACRDFECELKKGEFDHSKIHSWEDVAMYQDEWSPYLITDVACMKELYIRFSSMVYEDFKMNIKTRIALSQLSYEYWTQGSTSFVQPLHIPTKVSDDFFRRAVYGGMSMPQKQYYHSGDYDDTEIQYVTEKTNIDNEGHVLEEPIEMECAYLKKEVSNYLVDTDVVSLYPSAMLEMYPVGPMRVVNDPVELQGIMMKLYLMKTQEKPSAFCIVEVDMDVPKDLVTPVLPRKSKTGKGIKWDLKNIKKQVYCSVDIYRALKLGYVITDVYQAYVWDSEEWIFRQYVHELGEKKKQAKKGTSKYAIAKLMLNALYGKTIMRPVLEQCDIVFDSAGIEKFRRKNILENIILLEDGIDAQSGLYRDTPAFIQGTRIDENKACNKPSQTGTFVLAWSRYIMDKGVEAIDGWRSLNNSFFYRDTDSSVIHSSYLHNIQHMMGKEFGCLDFDVPGKIVEYVCIGPKAYIFWYQTKSGRLLVHKRCKGVSPSQWHHLTIDSYKDMLFNLSEITISDTEECRYEVFRRIGGRVTQKQKEYGVEPFSIRIEPTSKTVNRTKFTKGNRVVEEEFPRSDYGTLPIYFDESLIASQFEVYGEMKEKACRCEVCVRLGYFESQ
jgi:hypothetical protein